MASAPPRQVLLTGDIGGTHGRVQLWEITADDVLSLFRTDRASADYDSLADLLIAALAVARSALGVGDVTPTVGVLGLCGPVWNEGRRSESNNIPRWYEPGTKMAQVDASVIEARLGMTPNSLRFLNDFEANGWAVAALHDPAAPALAAPLPPKVLYAPPTSVSVERSAPACCVGAGTGLGVCCIVPVPAEGSTGFVVMPSEGGMASVLCPQDECEWRLLQVRRSCGKLLVFSYPAFAPR